MNGSGNHPGRSSPLTTPHDLMTNPLSSLRHLAGLALLLIVPMSPLQAQSESTPAPEMESFFEALVSDFEAREVFAIDAKSLALTLGLSLGWPVSESGVTEALGSEFRFGEIALFLRCDGEVPCVVSEEGAHVEITRATAEQPDHVELRLMVSRTLDASVAREFGTVNLVRSAEGWRLADGTESR